MIWTIILRFAIQDISVEGISLFLIVSLCHEFWFVLNRVAQPVRNLCVHLSRRQFTPNLA